METKLSAFIEHDDYEGDAAASSSGKSVSNISEGSIGLMGACKVLVRRFLVNLCIWRQNPFVPRSAYSLSSTDRGGHIGYGATSASTMVCFSQCRRRAKAEFEFGRLRSDHTCR